MDEILANAPAITIAVTTIACIGATELIKRLANQDVKGATTIVISAIIGVVVAITTGATWYVGLALGLAASGVMTGLSQVAGANQPNQESTSNQQGNSQNKSQADAHNNQVGNSAK